MMTHSDARIINETLERIATSLEKLLYQYSGFHTPIVNREINPFKQQLTKERT